METKTMWCSDGGVSQVQVREENGVVLVSGDGEPWWAAEPGEVHETEAEARRVHVENEADGLEEMADRYDRERMNAEASAAYVKKIAPFEDLEVAVPKTQGELRIHVKHSKRRGLFIHGFKPNSLAEQQGILCVGDELLAVEGEDVRAKALPGLVAVLKNHTGDAVRIKLRRHKYNGVEL